VANEEVLDIIQTMLSSAYTQGMAYQRMLDAQEEWNEEASKVVVEHKKLTEMLNLGEDKQEVQ
jgi:hypothetical protein